MDLYIYYRVSNRHAQKLQSQVSAMQADLAKAHGIAVSLKRRPEEKNGQQTWMEIYHAVPDNFDAILARAVEEAGLASIIDGERHTEHFLDVSSCA